MPRTPWTLIHPRTGRVLGHYPTAAEAEKAAAAYARPRLCRTPKRPKTPKPKPTLKRAAPARPRAAAKPSKPAADPFEAAFLRAFRYLDTGVNQVPLSDLRRALPSYSRAEFDRCLHALRGRSVTLSPDEGRFGPTPKALYDGGIEEGSRRLVYAALR